MGIYFFFKFCLQQKSNYHVILDGISPSLVCSATLILQMRKRHKRKHFKVWKMRFLQAWCMLPLLQNCLPQMHLVRFGLFSAPHPPPPTLVRTFWYYGWKKDAKNTCILPECQPLYQILSMHCHNREPKLL